jgi:hypothetical protein
MLFVAHQFDLLIRRPRRGGISIYALFGLVLLLITAGVAIDVSTLWGMQTEMRNGTDAASLAAAHTLVSDELLRLGEDGFYPLMSTARKEALAYGGANLAIGEHIDLQDNPRNEEDGDVVFGYIDPRNGQFVPAPYADLADPQNALHVNAVRVSAHRTSERGNAAGLFLGPWLGMKTADVITSSTAVLERHVIGFRPIGGKPLPIVPIGLLSDPTAADPECWEAQTRPVVDARGNLRNRDDYAYDAAHKKLVLVGRGGQGDGIYEMKLTLAVDAKGSARGNGSLLQVGPATEWSVLCRQIQAGVSTQDLSGPEFAGQLVLGDNNELRVPCWLAAPAARRPELGQLLQSLMSLQSSAEPRIWPLFARPADVSRQGDATAPIRGFVAARVARVELESFAQGGQTRQRVSVILQPCTLTTPTAITNGQRGQAAPDLWNLYIAKVRLAE